MVSPPPAPCGASELPRLVAAANRIFRPGGGDMAAAFPHLFAVGNRDRLRVIARGAQILAHAGYVVREAISAGTLLRIACFGAVFTAPEARGRGLATAVFQDAVAAARREGVEAGLVSGDGGVYRRAGFAPMEAPLLYTPPVPTATDVTVALAGPAEIAALEALAAAEPVRFCRARADWARIFACRTLFWKTGSIWLVRRGGAPVAYAAIEDRAPGEGPVRALELGGDRAALLEAAAALRQALGARVAFVAPRADAALASAASAAGAAVTSTALAFTCARWGAVGRLPFPGLDYV